MRIMATYRNKQGNQVTYTGRTEFFEKKENRTEWGNRWPLKTARERNNFYKGMKAK